MMVKTSLLQLLLGQRSQIWEGQDIRGVCVRERDMEGIYIILRSWYLEIVWKNLKTMRGERNLQRFRDSWEKQKMIVTENKEKGIYSTLPKT